jgi:hypothetical protein
MVQTCNGADLQWRRPAMAQRRPRFIIRRKSNAIRFIVHGKFCRTL